MYRIYNNIEDKIIFEGQPSEFVNFVGKIVIENGDFDMSILGISDAEEYIEDYCEDLEFEEIV